MSAARSYFVDSLAPITPAAVAHLREVTGGLPAAWGRYLGPDMRNELRVAAEHDIPILAISRRSSNVWRADGTGIIDGDADRKSYERLCGSAQTLGARVLSYVFLDVEQTPNLSAGYYTDWARSFDYPSVYMPNAVNWPASWRALAQAVSAGAPCFGTWVAHYQTRRVDGSAKFESLEWSQRPAGLATDAVPCLAW